MSFKSSSRFALAFEAPRPSFIYCNAALPVTKRPGHDGSRSGGPAPTDFAKYGNHSETFVGSSSTMFCYSDSLDLHFLRPTTDDSASEQVARPERRPGGNRAFFSSPVPVRINRRIIADYPVRTAIVVGRAIDRSIIDRWCGGGR